MIYTVIIACGIMICVLVFAQLNNEARVQNKQVRNFFSDIALRVFSDSPEKKSSFLLSASDDNASKVYPIVSTSITTGRVSENKKHQLDLPIETSDTTLCETSAEFFVEPDAANLRLYVRLLDQPFMWVCSADYSSIMVIVKNLEDWEIGDLPNEKKYRHPPFPPRLKKQIKKYRDGKKGNSIVMDEGKVPLYMNYNVFLGDTQYVVGCGGGKINER